MLTIRGTMQGFIVALTLYLLSAPEWACVGLGFIVLHIYISQEPPK